MNLLATTMSEGELPMLTALVTLSSTGAKSATGKSPVERLPEEAVLATDREATWKPEIHREKVTLLPLPAGLQETVRF
jgi:hypothetical protein